MKHLKSVETFLKDSSRFKNIPVAPDKDLNYIINYEKRTTEPFLNKLYTPKVVVPNLHKRNVFVKLPFLGSTSFQIRKKLQKLFCDKETSCNLKIVFTSPESKAFSPSRINYLRCYFQDLFTSISVVAAMLPIVEKPNAILMSEFVNIEAFHISLKKS